MLTPRTLLQASAKMGAAIALRASTFYARADERDGIEVNDIQSQLNATRVYDITYRHRLTTSDRTAR